MKTSVEGSFMMSKKIVLKASAGTGKTYRLSLEYIASLLRGESYKNILVMTFTKKATGEIEERIVEFLSILNSNSKETEILKKQNEITSSLIELYPDLEIKKERVESSFHEICKNRDRLRIYTIDGFINRIFKTVIAPFLGLETYMLIDSDEEYEIITRLLEMIFKKRESFDIFKNFLGNNMEKNLDNYISTLKALLDQRWKYILLQEARSKGKIPEKRPLTYSTDSRTPIEILDEMLSTLSEVAKIKNSSKKTNNTLGHFLVGASLPYLSLDSLESKEEFLREKALLLLEKPIWHGGKVKGKDVDHILDQLLELQESLRDKIGVELYNSEILQYERDVLSFIDELYRNYDSIKLKEGNLTFNDISTYTYMNYSKKELGLLKNGEITQYFQELFDGEIKTFFIDEFQDTSILQWKLLSAIAEKAKTVFCVGDEKQSLYSWRGGEKELFEKLPQIIRGEGKNLDTCYRSRRNIVEFTNQLFQEISSQYLDLEDIFESSWSFIPVKFIKSDESYVEIIDASLGESSSSDFDEDSEDTKKKAASNLHLDLILEKLKNDFNGDYRDIAIIGRTGAELSEMATRLSNEHIPFTIKSNKNIFQHRVNISTYRFLRFLAYEDFFSLLEFLRGDLIRLGNRELKFLLNGRESILDFMKSDKSFREFFSDIQISQELLEILEKVHEIFSLQRKNSGNMESIIVEIFKSFGALSFYNSSSDIKNYYRFLEVCKEFKTISDFIKTSETNPNNPIFSQVSVEDKNAVTLITIHSSKGLEYDTVFFIHNPKRSGNSGSNLNFYVDLDSDFANMRDFLIIDRGLEKIIRKSSNSSLFSRYDFIRETSYKEIQETINGWYVALTRAKRNMFIVLGGKKDDILKSSLTKLDSKIGIFDRRFEIPSDVSSSKASPQFADLSLDLLPLRLDEEKLSKNFNDQLEILKSGFRDRERKRILGTAVHYFLENIRYLTPEEISYARKKTISQYGGELGVENLNKLFTSREFLISLEENRIIFSKEWDHIYSEFEVKLEGELKRIDRLMIKKHGIDSKGEILIVDYKTGGWEETQIEDYKRAVTQLLSEDNLLPFYEIKTEYMSIQIPEEIFR